MERMAFVQVRQKGSHVVFETVAWRKYNRLRHSNALGVGDRHIARHPETG
jgi:predicted RNA binding protein YcfA (HicA-like mRNA interferase family)